MRSKFTACAPWLPPVTNTTNAFAGMKSNLLPSVIAARTGSPVRTVFTSFRYRDVMSKLIATVSAKRERNSTALPGTVFASWRKTFTLHIRAARTGGNDE